MGVETLKDVLQYSIKSTRKLLLSLL